MKILPSLVLLAALSVPAAAADRADYNRRASETDIATFQRLDLDRNARVTRAEARAEIDFIARFDDMDINRDGVVTTEELSRYVTSMYGAPSGE